MTPSVRTEDLIDANDVATLLGLSHRNSVYGYLSRYEDMPRPVVNLGPGRAHLWLRPEIEAPGQSDERGAALSHDEMLAN
jgi:glutathione-regulated potassium-efflux system ancillary protein KefG